MGFLSTTETGTKPQSQRYLDLSCTVPSLQTAVLKPGAQLKHDALLQSSTLQSQFTASISDGRQQQKVFLQGLYEGHIHALVEFTGNVQLWGTAAHSVKDFTFFLFQR